MISKALKNSLRCLSSTPRKLDQNPSFFITGGRGQLGRGMADELTKRYGKENVVLTDVSVSSTEDISKGYNKDLDVRNKDEYESYVADLKPTWIIHLPALLSATCESNLKLAKEVNFDSVFTSFELAQKHNCKLFIPSSIGAFGPNSPLDNVPDKCIQDPTTYYGVGKVFVELFGNYYRAQHNLDFRCLRYPGIISPVAEPGGGTTDYAVDIFHQIVGAGKDSFTSYLAPTARLPMMLESDCIQGTCDFLAVDNEKLKAIPNQTGYYNLAGCDFTPEEIANEIKSQFSSDFEMKYDVDLQRQNIADNWPKVFLADGAKEDWGFVCEADSTAKLTEYMIKHTPRA